MPEGPEVSVMVYQLNKRFKNSTLKGIQFHGGRYTRHPLPEEYKQFTEKLPSKIISINNKGKFIYFKLENNINLCISLSLSGHIVFEKRKYSHYEFIMKDNSSFFIDDLRNFARLYFYTDKQLDEKLSKIGPDVLHDKISFKEFKDRLIKKGKVPVGIAIIDQKVISGVGNYIRSDALYCAKISPYRLVKDLREIELKTLFQSIKKIIKMSYQEQLKSNDIHSYKFYVYGRKVTDKGEKVVRERLEKNRNIYWVPEVQV